MQSHKSATIVRKIKIEDPFCRLPKTILDDPSISWKAKGILGYLLGKPQGWKVNVKDICNKGSDGESSVRAGLKELRDSHYLRLELVRSKGKISEWLWIISDTPTLEAEVSTNKDGDEVDEKPDGDFQHLVNPHVENHHISKKEGSKNDCKQDRKSTPIVGDFSKLDSGPRHQLFINLWNKAFKEHNRVPYSFVPRDHWATKILLGSPHDDSTLLSLAKRGWDHKDTYVKRKSMSMVGFLEQINIIAAEANVPVFNNHNI